MMFKFSRRTIELVERVKYLRSLHAELCNEQIRMCELEGRIISSSSLHRQDRINRARDELYQAEFAAKFSLLREALGGEQ